ncbi:ribonuclease T [uncultured Sphingomonas sp.]|uniref:ribonuclease T2 family protein n=1 Tax=uncultured Sphingomonas sp. TaxID=158754 RepID=UPI0025FEDA89|nr:ribonuclease T [uncultured Sphingomonas sp.]
MTRLAAILAGGAALLAPAIASAQANVCRIPSTIERPRPDLPSASQPVRRLPIGSYTLAISWSPEYCRAGSRDRGARSNVQCRGGNDFGFVLHGLWPDGVGKEWPQYCQATPILPARLIRQHLCSTPSAQLMQHEWSKHGTCMPGTSPAAYFARSTAMFGRLRFPDMDALSRTSLTVADFKRRFAAVNGLPAGAVRVTTKKAGWLDELWLCTDKRFRYVACDAEQGGGAPAGQRLLIWRGHR